MQTKTMDLSRITIDEGIQSRDELDHNLTDEYAQKISDGAKFPPPVVIFDGTTYWLASGFHRYFAHKIAGNVATTFEIRVGTKRDAILLSVKENDEHGKRRTPQDKRRAVSLLLADEIWGNWSDREIAVATNVSHPFVAAIRNPEKVAAKKAKKGQQATERDPEETSNPGVVIGNPKGLPEESGNVSTNSQVIHRGEPGDEGGGEDPKQVLKDALDVATDRIAQLSKGNSEATADEQAQWQGTLDQARADFNALHAERDSIAAQRDAYMRENAELKAEVKKLSKRLKQALAK